MELVNRGGETGGAATGWHYTVKVKRCYWWREIACQIYMWYQIQVSHISSLVLMVKPFNLPGGLSAPVWEALFSKEKWNLFKTKLYRLNPYRRLCWFQIDKTLWSPWFIRNSAVRIHMIKDVTSDWFCWLYQLMPFSLLNCFMYFPIILKNKLILLVTSTNAYFTTELLYIFSNHLKK